MRADRLISLLILLQQHPRLTARELARRLEVSERTILRDMDALSIAGVPVYADRGALGGFRLLQGYRLDLSGLRTPELATLLLGGRDHILDDLGWSNDAASARQKLRYAVTPGQRTAAEELASRIYIDESPWFAPLRRQAALETLQAGVWQNRRVEIAYARMGKGPSIRTVAPYALVAKAGALYHTGLLRRILPRHAMDRGRH